MKTKLLVVGVILLLSATAFPLAKAQPRVPVPRPADVLWSDSFDTYTNGQRLDGTTDDGGWRCWDNNTDAYGTVTDAQAKSTPYSDCIQAASDNIHEFNITSGTFTFIVWQYIPSNFTGQTYFILLSNYTDGADQYNKIALRVRFDSDLQVVESEYDAISLPLETGMWCELRTEINLTANWFQFYYDGDLLIQKNWTATIQNDGSGLLKLSAVGLYASGSTPVYYDDLAITTQSAPPHEPTPSLQIGSITASTGVINAEIKNNGDGNATNVSWTIGLNGGFLLFGKSTTGSSPSILAGAQMTAVSNKILGIGQVTITVTATCTENTTTVIGTASGFVFLFWVLGIK